MKFFDFLKTTQAPHVIQPVNNPDSAPAIEATQEIAEKRDLAAPVEIPEQVFVEYLHPTKKNKMEEKEQQVEVFDLSKLYHYLDQNLEKKGYEDALINPDSSYMEEHVRLIQNELDLLVSRITTDYKNHVNKIDFHISTRKRSGMIDTVDELLTHKKTIEENLQSVLTIHESSKRGEGLSQNIVLSYRKGFKNGFAAITFNTILNRVK